MGFVDNPFGNSGKFFSHGKGVAVESLGAWCEVFLTGVRDFVFYPFWASNFKFHSFVVEFANIFGGVRGAIFDHERDAQQIILPELRKSNKRK